MRLGNVAHTPDSDAAFLDFGFAALRPRVHELAYALSWMILTPDDSGRAEDFPWDRLEVLVHAYEEQAATSLTATERANLGPYTAAVPLYLAAISGYTNDPAAHLIGNEPFIQIADWILEQRPTAR